jgi:hypothetical protein
MSILFRDISEPLVFGDSYEKRRKNNRGRNGLADTAGNIVSR